MKINNKNSIFKKFNLILPIYYKFDDKISIKPSKGQIEKGINKGDLIVGKIILLSMNWFRNSHHHEQNAVKTKYESLIDLSDCFKIEGKYEIEYNLYYKSKSCDLLNIGSIISKFLNDKLQSSGIVKNDNVQYLVKETFMVKEIDVDNPRMEITIRDFY